MKKRIMPIRSVRIFKGGKAAFLRIRDKKGNIKNTCLSGQNLDTADGCIGHVLREHLWNVERDGLYFADFREKYRNNQGYLKNRCGYCYGARNNYATVVPKSVDKNTEKDFIGLREEGEPVYIRLGKNTEAAHAFYVPTLMEVLDLCIKYNDAVKGAILPTKMLPFGKEGMKNTYLEFFYYDEGYPIGSLDGRVRLVDIINRNLPSGEDIASKLKEANVSVNYSIGYDKLEKGVCSQGFTNRWRIEQAKKYQDMGVNVSLTIVCDLTQSIEDNIRLGSSVQEALDSGIKIIRFLPLRITSNYIAEAVTGKPRSSLLYNPFSCLQSDLFTDYLQEEGLWVPRNNNELVQREIHPDFGNLIKDRKLGICGEIGGIHYCDKCNLPGEKWEDHPMDVFLSVEYNTERKRPSINTRRVGSQKKLKF